MRQLNSMQHGENQTFRPNVFVGRYVKGRQKDTWDRIKLEIQNFERSFMGPTFSSSADMLHVVNSSEPAKAASSMLTVYIYHAPLRSQSTLLRKKLRKSRTKFSTACCISKRRHNRFGWIVHTFLKFPRMKRWAYKLIKWHRQRLNAPLNCEI